MLPRRPLLLLVVASFLAAGRVPARDATIAASATAGSDYVRAHDAKGMPVPESYVFTEGKYFPGNTRDGSLERVTFPAVTKALAATLAKQNYFPAANAESAQLIIMVHWGMTDIYEDPQRELNQQALNDATAAYNASVEATGKADPTALNMALSDREGAQQGTMAAVNRNAQLLGYAHTLQKERRALNPTQAEISMSNELNEERYFVVLMAYDNQARLKEKKSRPMWITRLSVRSPGNNFTEALPALAKVGGEIFGQQHDDLVRVNTSTKLGSVKLGELEILGPANEKVAPGEKGK
jgi:hypothetical protein